MSERSEFRLIRSLRKFLLIDLLADSKARGVFVYVAVVVALGAAIYHYIEGWSWLDSLYFMVITLTTIGYGDFAPKTSLGKGLTIFVALNGIAILVMLIDHIRRLRRTGVDDPN